MACGDQRSCSRASTSNAEVSLGVLEGQDTYEAGEANGVEAGDEESWDMSFRLIEDPAGD